MGVLKTVWKVVHGEPVLSPRIIHLSLFSNWQKPIEHPRRRLLVPLLEWVYCSLEQMKSDPFLARAVGSDFCRHPP